MPDEQHLLSDPETVSQKTNHCGVSSFNVITGNFDHDKFDACLMKELGISKACVECYAISGEYGAKNCKADCLLGWCKAGCLSCTALAQKYLATCTGFSRQQLDHRIHARPTSLITKWVTSRMSPLSITRTILPRKTGSQ